MLRWKKKIRHEGGFTLVELILIIVLAGILGVFLAQFVRTSTENSAQPLQGLLKDADLQAAMERVTAEYRRMLQEYVENQVPVSLKNLEQYAEKEFGVMVVPGETGFVTFHKVAGDTYQASSIRPVPSSGAALLITLKRGGRRLRALFTE